MAKFNEILAGRFNRFAQKLFSMKGGPPASQLSGDIQLSHGLFHGRENRYLESWNVFGVSSVVGPTAGDSNMFQLALDNPNAGRVSGVVAVIERLQVITSLADVISVSEAFIGTLDLANVFSGVRLDSRMQVVGSVLHPSSAVAVGAGTPLGLGIWQFQTQANVPLEIIPQLDDAHGLPMVGNHALRITGTSLNLTSWFNVWWRERVLEDSEKF